MDVFYFFRHVMVYSFVFPLIIGFLNFKYLNKGLRIVLFLICFDAFTEITLTLLVWSGFTTLWALNIYIPIEFFIYGLIYSYFLKELIAPKYIYIVIAMFVCFSLFNSLFFQDFMQFNNYVMTVRSLIYVIYSILFFYKVMTEMKIIEPVKEPMIWINIAVLIVFSTNLFIYILSNKLLALSGNLKMIIFGIPAYSIGIGYIIMGIGFFQVKKSKEKTIKR